MPEEMDRLIGATALALTRTPRASETATNESRTIFSKPANALWARSGFVVVRFATMTTEPGARVRIMSAGVMPEPSSCASFDLKVS